ncbi:MAG: GNAT family N-acetyltransferase [Spirochaetota bacterium]
MAWAVIRRKDFPEILAFLKARESTCVMLTSRLIDEDQALVPLKKNKLLVNRSVTTGTIQEVLLFTPGGLILPVLDTLTHPSALDKGLAAYIENKAAQIHSIMGIASQVAVIEGMLKKQATRVDYYLMTMKDYVKDTEQLPSIAGLHFRKAKVNDAKLLAPLQADYEKEEVLIDPERFNPSFSLLQLKKSLQTQIVVVAELNGEIIAKAGTNAIGFNYCQIGGVFTKQKYRSMGIAKRLMRFLAGELEQQQKKICLFVKKNNTPAINLYSGLGLTIYDNYRISYYFGLSIF